jgi:hypothetical protein
VPLPKRFLIGVLYSLVILIGLGGCASRPAVPSRELPQPPVVMEVLDPSLQQYAPMWQREIGRRFPYAVGILVHGGDFVPGQWIAGSDPTHEHVEPMQQVVHRIQARYPDRTVVLVSCNPGHLKLGIPGVYYGTDSIWCVPDRELTAEYFSTAREKIEWYGHPLQEDPYSLPFGNAPAHTRWQDDPTVLGNIFEFVVER